MRRTSELKRQHDAMRAAMAAIQALVEAVAATLERPEAGALADALVRLEGTIRIHRALEDGALYPALMTAPDREVASVARAFVAEMGELHVRLGAYLRRWREAGAIQADPRRFRNETLPLFAALRDRLEREERVLFPLAERPPTDARRAA